MEFLRSSVDTPNFFRVFFSDGYCTDIVTSKRSYRRATKGINGVSRYPTKILPSCFITLVDV